MLWMTIVGAGQFIIRAPVWLLWKLPARVRHEVVRTIHIVKGKLLQTWQATVLSRTASPREGALDGSLGRTEIFEPILPRAMTDQAANPIRHFADGFEAFKMAFRARLDQLIARSRGLSRFTEDIHLLSEIDALCSCMSNQGILRLPGTEIKPEGPREMQHFLATCCETTFMISQALSSQLDSTLTMDLVDHQDGSLKLIQELLDSLAKRYVESVKHSPISEVVFVALPTTSRSDNVSRVIFWHNKDLPGGDHESPDTDTQDGGSERNLHTSNIILTQSAPWLKFKHDGFELCCYHDYRRLHQPFVSNPGEECSSELEHAALFQSQLTFGLLESITGRKIPESQLVEKGPDGSPVMTARHLAHIIREWMESMWRLKEMNVTESQQRAADAWHTLIQAQAELLSDYKDGRQGTFLRAELDPQDILKMWSVIAVIGESLTMACAEFRVRPAIDSDTPIWNVIKEEMGDSHRVLEALGWCPSITSKLAVSVCNLEYASTVTPIIREDAVINNHRGCNSQVCRLNTINPAEYANRHVDNKCRCAYAAPPVNTVLAILDNEEIPLIIVHQDVNEAGDHLKLMCINSASARHYVAFSHVWADGLGSTTETGLPTCQLHRLGAIARQLVPGGAFWIDALCVPAHDGMRRRAIGMMCETYRSAHAVLVLDSGIRSCSVRAPLKERLLRVVTSGWTQRLWTVQEALLAEALVFEFADGMLSVNELHYSASSLRYDPVVRFLALQMEQLMRNVFCERPVFKLGYVSNALRSRTTSKMEDETLAIAGLVGVDAFDLVHRAPQTRMREFLLAVRDMSPDILFLEGPKLGERGFQWALASFMRASRGHMDYAQQNAVCTPEGLLVSCIVLRFPETTFDNGERWILRNLPKNICLLIVGDGRDSPDGTDGGEHKFTCDAFLPKDGLYSDMKSSGAVVYIGSGDGSGHAGSRTRCDYMSYVAFAPIRPDNAHQMGHRIIDTLEPSSVDLCVM